MTATRTISAADTVTEADFMATVIELARFNGWRIYHPHNSRRSDPGFPDLCMVRDGVLRFMELKSEKGKPTVDQVAWIAELRKVGMHCNGHVRALLLRPSDMPTIRELLA